MAQFITIIHGGRGSAETPKLYYVIYEQPLTVSLTVKIPFFYDFPYYGYKSIA